MIKKEEIYNRSKNAILTNNKQFRKDINELRKMLNSYSKCEVFVDDELADAFAYDISVQFDVMIPKYKVRFSTLCDILKIYRGTVSRITCNYPIVNKYTRRAKGLKSSYLVDRQHHARNIIDGNTTIILVAKATGYGHSTVGKWVTDYKKFGNRMTTQAIAFRREL